MCRAPCPASSLVIERRLNRFEPAVSRSNEKLVFASDTYLVPWSTQVPPWWHESDPHFKGSLGCRKSLPASTAAQHPFPRFERGRFGTMGALEGGLTPVPNVC